MFFKHYCNEKFWSSTLNFTSPHSHVWFEWCAGCAGGKRSPYARTEGVQTTIGRLHRFGHREGPHPQPRERDKDAPVQVQEKNKACASTADGVFFLSSLYISLSFYSSPPYSIFWIYRDKALIYHQLFEFNHVGVKSYWLVPNNNRFLMAQYHMSIWDQNIVKCDCLILYVHQRMWYILISLIYTSTLLF